MIEKLIGLKVHAYEAGFSRNGRYLFWLYIEGPNGKTIEKDLTELLQESQIPAEILVHEAKFTAVTNYQRIRTTTKIEFHNDVYVLEVAPVEFDKSSGRITSRARLVFGTANAMS